MITNTYLSKLQKSNQIVYIFTRLFDHFERIKAEYTEEFVIRGIKNAFEIIGEDFPTRKITFVPYRDTNQHLLKCKDKAKVIYEQDLNRLDNSCLLAGFLDGISKDEGVCFEIGYSYGKGIPVIALFTDFIQREYKHDTNSIHVADPVIMAMLKKTIRSHEILNPEKSFFYSLQDSFFESLEKLENGISQLLLEQVNTETEINSITNDVYIEVGGGQFEWERNLQKEIEEELQKRGYSTKVSKRNLSANGAKKVQNKELDIIGRGINDIENLKFSKVVIICADMDEMSSGSAAIQGLAKSLGKRIILLDTRTINHVGDGDHRMSRNLMIDYSADVIASSKELIFYSIEN